MKTREVSEPEISVVIPAHNEADGIVFALHTIIKAVEQCVDSWEIIVVDDGSKDETYAEVCKLAEEEVRLKVIQFSRNFGKEAAILAGLRITKGKAVITMDADLQHPPRFIPLMISRWREGAKIVDAVKRDRTSDSVIVKWRASFFNTLLTRMSGIDVQNSSDFKLLDRVVVSLIINELPEKQRFYRGLVDWVGYRHVKFPFDIDARANGEGKWSIFDLVSLAMTAIVSFTSAPLRIVSILGLITLVFGIGVGIDALWSWYRGVAVSGFATLIITILIIGSFIMISLGIMGEYIAKIYDEIKGRPAYIVSEMKNVESNEACKINSDSYSSSVD